MITHCTLTWAAQSAPSLQITGGKAIPDPHMGYRYGIRYISVFLYRLQYQYRYE